MIWNSRLFTWKLKVAPCSSLIFNIINHFMLLILWLCDYKDVFESIFSLLGIKYNSVKKKNDLAAYI